MKPEKNTKDMQFELQNAKHVMQELQGIIEGSFDGILVTDGDGNVLLVNQSYVRNTGIEKQELLGHNVRELINPVWMKNSVALLAIEQRHSVSMHHTTKKDTNIMVTGTPIFDEKGDIKRVIINTRDISEIYQLREELLKAKEMEKIYFDQFHNQKNRMSSWSDDIVIADQKMRDIYALAKKISNFDTTVLISGESGVGKEMLAQFLHKEGSRRKDKPFVAVNCGAIPENLLESELFGYTDGTFTGAVKGGKQGLFEDANGGTLLLDEIGEMSLNLQVKLLRVLEMRTVTKLGSSGDIPIDVRLIAVTNKNLLEMVKEGTFREDLYYRLNVISIEIPPLRERTDEIAPLALRFINQFNKQYGQSKRLTFEVLNELAEYPWPGNTRQLKNIIENMVVVSDNEYLQRNDVPWIKVTSESETETKQEDGSLQDMLNEYEETILRRMRDQYGSSRKIAEILKIDQSTVIRKLHKYGITPG